MKRHEAKGAACGPSSKRTTMMSRLSSQRRSVFFLLALVLAVVTQSNAAEVRCKTADCLAGALIRNIPRGETIALVPFGPPNTSIPRRVADGLHDGINSALYRKSKRRHKLVSRELRDEIWRFYQSEREKSDYQAFWKKRRVSVIIQCKDRGSRPGGLALHCVASGVGEKSRLKGDVIGPSTVLPVEDRWFHYRYTLTRLGLELAGKNTRPGEISKVFIVDRALGQPTALSRDVGRELQVIMEERLRSRREHLKSRAGMKAVLGRDDKTASQKGRIYELRGEVAWMSDKAARLSARLVDPATGDNLRTARVDIERSWLPENLRKRTLGYYTATARAVESGRLDAQSAKLAVKNLARAMVVAKALGVSGPGIKEIRMEADGMRALRHALQRGIPKDERFGGTRPDGEGGWRTELRARVVKLGASAKPVFTAKLAKGKVRAGEDIRVEMSTKAKETLHVAAFSWGADGNVVRLYPHPYEPKPRIPANGRLALPRDSRCPIASAPLAGKSASHEAVVVLAAYERLAFEKLAPSFCFDPKSEKPGKPVSGEVFLNALVGLDLSRAGIAVLPYRVER